jgi:hypothetical protein
MTTTPAFALDSSPTNQKKNTLKTILWTILCIIAMVALAIQYLHFHADLAGLDQRLRPTVTRICQITGCELPVRIDTKLIRSNQLLITSHPSIPDALKADAVITNYADFSQPFPELILSFEDLQGNTIAFRRFKPEEYLRGDLKGATMMSPHQPIRLMLELVDPGPEAVNYSLYIPE